MVLSTAKVEYISAFSASCEVVWIRKLLYDLFDLQLDVTCIFKEKLELHEAVIKSCVP